jgi:ABC-type polysaccharide/polyol phosphate export permease
MAEAAQVPLNESFRVQRRVLGALFMRELLTRYGRHNIGFLWLFVEPMIFTLGVTALWKATKTLHASDLPIEAFALAGYSSVLLWRNMPGRCIGALWANMQLMYHRNIRALDIYFARVMLEFAGVTMSFFGLSILFISIGWIEPPEDIIKIAAGWLMLAWFGAALGILLGALSHQYELVDKFWHPASYLLFPLSGAAFMVSALPASFREVVLWVPIVHCIEMIRDGYFGSKVMSIYDPFYVICVSLVMTVVALILVRWTENRLTPA